MVHSIWGGEELLAGAIPFRMVIGAQVAKVIQPCLLCISIYPFDSIAREQ